jgi:hypothetical protein
MGSNYERLFKVLQQDSMPTYLCERICDAILQERDHRTLYRSNFRERARLILSSLTGASSLVGLVFYLPALVNAASATGFATFVGLFMSDGDVLATHLGTFGTSLLETLPGTETMMTLFLIAVFLVSLQNFIHGLFYQPPTAVNHAQYV